jgi:integrase
MGGKLAANTIETRLWGISELHRSHFLPSPTRHRLVDLALKAVKRKYGSMSKQAPPLCKEEVLAAINRLGDTRLEKRDKAMLWIATDSWCRASEIVAFKVRDIQRQDDGSSLLLVSRSKTDQDGKGDYGFLSARGTAAVLDWIETAKLKDKDPILTKSQQGCINKVSARLRDTTNGPCNAFKDHQAMHWATRCVCPQHARRWSARRISSWVRPVLHYGSWAMDITRDASKVWSPNSRISVRSSKSFRGI